MAYGLTNQGFIIKRLVTIQDEIKNSFKSIFGDGINIDDNSPFGQIIGILSERESLIWELAFAVYNSQYPDTAENVSLENCAALVGVEKLEPTESTAVIRARGTQGTVITIESVISVEGNTDIKFETDNDATIQAPTNNQQKITFSNEPQSGTWIIDFDGETTNPLDYDASNSEIETELELLSNISDVSVTGNYIDGITIEFINADGLQQQTTFEIDSSLFYGSTPVDVDVEVIDEGGAYIDIPCTALEVGYNQAPAMSLTIIETLISGWDEAYNLEDAIIGRDEETDEEFRIRRTIYLQISRSGSLLALKNEVSKLNGVKEVFVYENDTDLTDEYGRPPHSFEVIVDGGDEETIATTILNTKSAGIETFGDIEEEIVDSQGTLHTIKFSRPELVSIYLDVTVRKDFGSELTEQEIKNVAKNYINNLTIGGDIIIYPKFVCQFDSLSIIDLEIKIGTSPGPTTDDNIYLLSTEKANITDDDINVTII